MQELKIFILVPRSKTGAVVSVDNFDAKDFLNHKVNYSCGYMESESSELLKGFFANKRNN